MVSARARRESERPRSVSGTHPRAREEPSLDLVVGDITAQDVDALVTASGYGPYGQSAVELALRRKAGPGLEAAYARALAARGGTVEVGELVVTEGFALAARHVLHTRPPSFDLDASERCARLLGEAVRSALEAAEDAGARSLAIASLGTGAYGFPPNIAAPTTLAALYGWLTRSESRLTHARVVVFGPHMLTVYAEAAMRVLPTFVPRSIATGGVRLGLARA